LNAPKNAPTAIRRAVVRGRVQGGSVRAGAADEALGRGLKGWVRNRRDGSVEALFVGPPDAVADMIEAAHQGPPAARVAAVDVVEGSPDELDQRNAGERFSVLPTR
jgi:acylphosphatase